MRKRRFPHCTRFFACETGTLIVCSASRAVSAARTCGCVWYSFVVNVSQYRYCVSQIRYLSLPTHSTRAPNCTCNERAMTSVQTDWEPVVVRSSHVQREGRPQHTREYHARARDLPSTNDVASARKKRSACRRDSDPLFGFAAASSEHAPHGPVPSRSHSLVARCKQGLRTQGSSEDTRFHK